MEDGWWRIPLSFVLLCPPQGKAFYKTYSCHHFNNLSSSCVSLVLGPDSTQTLLQKSVQKRKKKEKWIDLFKHAWVDSFLSIQTTPAELQQCWSPFQMTLHRAPVFKTQVVFFLFLYSRELLNTGGGGALGKHWVNVLTRSCIKLFHILIHVAEPGQIRS